MNKKLRLLVTQECPNHCPMCCNNSWDFSKLPVVDRWNYEEIMITGGEPLLYPAYVSRLIRSIREIQKVMGIECKIYLYTSRALPIVGGLLYEVDGIVYIPHSKADIREFLRVNTVLLYTPPMSNISLRLNLFNNMRSLIPEDTDLHRWKVKDIKWIKDCPVPEGEDFRRIAELWA